MKAPTKRIFALAGILALGLTAVRAQSDGALLDALVQKGVLSDQEAEDIRASEAKDYATTPAGKLSISNHITQLKLYGDARLRFEYLDEHPSNNSAVANGNYGSHSTTTDRSRYRIRVGADYTFTDHFKAGFELESATAADSANQTMGNEFGKFPINVGLIYLQWQPTDWVTLTGGKQRNPLYTTDLVWDADINPEGASEVATWTMPLDFSTPAPVSNDPKAVSAPSEPSTASLTVGLTAAQFIYADSNEYTLSGFAANNASNSDIWMFVEQVPVQFNFNKDTFIKEVPGFMSYMGGGITPGAPVSGATASVGNGSSVTFASATAADHLQLFTAPGEFDFKAADLPFRVYWDFSLNLQGKDRVQDIYLGNTPTSGPLNQLQTQNQSLSDSVAWLAGVQVGQNKKKGDWSIKGDFRQIGLGAVDPNINDSDFADSFLNQQGFRIQSIYNFTDFLTGSLTFYDTWQLKDNLFTGSNPATVPLGGGMGGTVTGGTVGTATTGTASLTGISSSQRVQVDLLWKF